MSGRDVIVHLTTLPAWFEALHAGRFEAPSLATEGFIHLSSPDTIHLPANAMYRDVADPWLLVVDPAGLRAPLRWEIVASPSDEPLEFPHLYGPLNLDAVVAVVPYPRNAAGGFDPPAGLPGREQAAERALAMEWYLARSRAARRTELPAGVSVRHPGYSVSYEHNRVILHRPMGPAQAAELCARELAGLGHWQVCVDGPVSSAAVDAFQVAGWSHVENLLMVAVPPLAPPSPGVAVTSVRGDELAGPRAAMWRRDLPGASDETIRQLIEREQLNEQVTNLHHLVVRDLGMIVAQADLYLLGATAQIDWVETEPDHRGRGHATAIVLAAVERAREHGCDVVFLRADVDDWPWRFYERLGFETVASAHIFDRDAVPPEPTNGTGGGG